MTKQAESDSSSDQTQIENYGSIETQVESGNSPDAEQIEESSTSENSENPRSLLDLVKNVVKESEEAESQTAQEEESEESDNTEEKTEEETNPPSSDETDVENSDSSKDDEKLPFNNHPRFKALIQEKNSYKEDAAHFRNFSHYMATKNLTAEEVNQGLEFLAAIKSDPIRAREMIAETNKYLDRVAGVSLPDDINELVENGEMSADAARELAQTKAQLELERNRQAATLQQQQAANSNYVRDQIVNAIEQWDQQVMAKDPDYQSKRKLVLNSLELAQTRNPARTPQEALAYAEAAYKETNEYLKGLMPRKVEIKNPVSSQSVSSAKPQPKNLEDVVRLAMNKN